MYTPARIPSDHLKILLVDDEEVVLNATCDYLTACFSFEIDTVVSGEEALTKLSHTQYDAIIADYKMEVMNGLDLLSVIREKGDQTPFIIFTGKGREEVVIASFEQGADGYVQKGGEIRSQFADLAQKVKTIVHSKRAARALIDQDKRHLMLFETMEQGVIYQDSEGIIIEANPAAERILGIPYDQLIGRSLDDSGWTIIDENNTPVCADKQPSIRALRTGKKICNTVVGIFDPRTDEYRWILVHATPLFRDGEKNPFQVYSIFSDITDLRKAEEQVTLHAERLSALLTLNRLADRSREELLDYAIEASLTITQSRFSFIGLLNPEETEVTIHSWSPSVLESCTIQDKSMKFRVEDCGLWADVIKKRVPLIVNSCSGNTGGRGHPEGHVPISRFLEVPVFDGDHIVAILAVANKPWPYEGDDSQALIALGNELWGVIHQKEIHEALYLKNYAIESSMNGIALASLSGLLTYVNPAFLSIWKYQSPDQVLGKNAVSFWKKSGQAEEVINTIRISGRWQGEMEAELADGAHAVLLVSAHTILDESGSPQAIMASFIDITEKKQAEKELIQANMIIEGMLDGIHDIVGLQLPDHTIVRYNKAGYEALGLSSSDIAGKKCYELIGRDVPCVPCATSEAIARGEAYTVQKYIPELGKYLECTSNPVLNADGEPELVVELLHDITVQKRAEEALRESEERFRQLFNNASDAIFLHELREDNTHGRFIEVNDAACRALGYSHEELLEKAVFDINTISDKEAAPDITMHLISGGHVIFEGTHIRKDGSIFPVEVSAHLFELHGSRVVLSICRDITERKRNERAIFEANRKLQLLSSITRHDILNSLGGLLLFLDSIPRSDVSPDIRANLDRILSYALTIQKQIEFTHDYQVLGFEKALWQDLSRCFQKAAEQFDARTVIIEESLSGAQVFADPMLEKVIYNLIDNALRYGGPTLSRISGYYRTEGEEFIWFIEDDGAGVAPEMKEQIMQRGVGCNTGFGLFLSAEILSITGMTIKETGDKGKGARFEIRVPKGMFRLVRDMKPEDTA
jgi:PAS domain S-box-containing protein